MFLYLGKYCKISLQYFSTLKKDHKRVRIIYSSIETSEITAWFVLLCTPLESSIFKTE